jgi:hypothetical protein
VLDVLADGVRAQAQRLGDLAVGEAVDDPDRDLLLARRQRRELAGRDAGLPALELEHGDVRAVVVERAQVAVQDRRLAGPQLDVDPPRAAAAHRGGGQEPVQPLLGVDDVRAQPPGRVVEVDLGLERVADRERRAREVEHRQRLVALALDPLAPIDRLQREGKDALSASASRMSFGPMPQSRSLVAKWTLPVICPSLSTGTSTTWSIWCTQYARR